MKLLVVEDEEDLREALCYGLRKCGYAVDAAGDGAEAAEKCEVSAYDLVVLDLNLPGLSGMEALEQIRRTEKETKVLILSARTEIDDKIAGLDAGANDYLTKPFHFGELEARVRALLRRAFVQSEAALVRGGLRLDTTRKKADFQGRSIELSMREFAILEYLMTHMGRPVSAEELLEHVWDSEIDPFTNQVKVYMSTIRRKLSAFTDETVIRSIRNAGYVIDAEEARC